MKKITLLASLVLFTVMVFGCHTLGIREVPGPEGVYLITMETQMGDMESTLALNADGTGYVEGMMGKMEFSDARIEGNSFDITMPVETPNGEIEITLKGAVDGDNISGTTGSPMGESSFTGQRKE
jgi:hypothetical protein